MQVVDALGKLLLGGLVGAFMLGILVGMVVIGRAVILDFVEREPDAAMFAVGPHVRNMIVRLAPWHRRLFRVARSHRHRYHIACDSHAF